MSVRHHRTFSALGITFQLESGRSVPSPKSRSCARRSGAVPGRNRSAHGRACEVEPDDRVLDIGTGSGYAAAVLSRVAAQVFTIERHPDLAATARERLARLGYDNVEVRCGDGTLGWP